MEAFGFEVAWQAENDPAASIVLKHHWPRVLNIGDISAVDWSSLERVDGIIGGYPCQPFSLAGARKGTDDERHLWPHIAECLRVLRPRWALFENVAGHLSLGFDVVLADLAAIGFDAEWSIVRASDVGAPHQRRRLYILATNTDSDPIWKQSVTLTERGREAWFGSIGEGFANANGDGCKELAQLNSQSTTRGQVQFRRHAARCGDQAIADSNSERWQGRAGTPIHETGGGRNLRTALAETSGDPMTLLFDGGK